MWTGRAVAEGTKGLFPLVADEGGVAGHFAATGGWSGVRKALTLCWESLSRPATSYSSRRLARSSSEVTETSASRSSVGCWHRRLTGTPHPQSSVIFADSSAIHKIAPEKVREYKDQGITQKSLYKSVLNPVITALLRRRV